MSTAPLAPLPGTTGCQTTPSVALLRLLVSLLGKASPLPRSRATSSFHEVSQPGSLQTPVRLAQGWRRAALELEAQPNPLLNCVSTGSTARVEHAVPWHQVGEGMWQQCQGCIRNASCNSTLAAPVTRDLVPLASSLPR